MTGLPTAPRARSVRDALETSATAAGLGAVVAAIVIAALASSRSAHHTISAPAIVVLVGMWTAALVSVGWPQGVYAGASDVLRGAVVFDPEPLPGPRWAPDDAAITAERRADALDPRSIAVAAAAVSLLAAAWAVAGTGLVVAVLNGRQAPWYVIAAAVAGFSGPAYVIVDTIARRHGMAAARRLLDAPPRTVPLRQRAWKQVALPLAAVQAVVNGAGTWVLFHSYHRMGGVPPALTRHVALADAVVMFTLIGVVYTTTTATWGAVDVALGRVSTGTGTGRTIGWQAILYAGALGLVLAKLAQTFLPAALNLIEVGVTRAALAA